MTKKISQFPLDSSPATTDTLATLDPLNKQITIQSLVDFIAENLPAGDGWNDLGVGVSSVTYLGNRQYEVLHSGSVLSLLSPGMRYRIDRETDAPTQCTSLNGTNQYWNDTTVSGITFTDDFVVSAWVRLTSYGGSSGCAIVSRYNGTSGFELRLGALGSGDGRVQLTGYNAGGANYSAVVSYQSVPLNKWVHITAQLDMSAFTATSTTSYVMIDGVDVPCFVQRGGTNPTALIQAGDLQAGASNTAAFFPGKIAQVALFGAKVTQSTMQGYISQGMTGSETNCVGFWSFDGSGDDASTSNNDLTAQNSADATNADSPFGIDSNGNVSNYDYGLVMKVSGSTAYIQVPEGCTIPTTGDITSVNYAQNGTPIGFPVATDRWELESLYLSSQAQASPTAGTYYNLLSARLKLPAGHFKELTYSANVYFVSTGASPIVYTALSTSTSSPTNKKLEAGGRASSAGGYENVFTKSAPISVSSATDYYLILKQEGTGGGTWSLQLNAVSFSRIYTIPAGI